MREYRIKEYKDGYKVQTGFIFGLLWFNKKQIEWIMYNPYNRIIEYKTIEEAKEHIQIMKLQELKAIKKY